VNPELNHDQVSVVLKSTALTALPPPKGGLQTCGGVAYSVAPNYHYGYGRIDAIAAVELAKVYQG
jgi:hypothetical protein